MSLKEHTSSSHQVEENDCRKEPQKLQEEGPEEEGVSIPHLSLFGSRSALVGVLSWNKRIPLLNMAGAYIII